MGEYTVLENLAPRRVFHFFEDICSIPHGSGNTLAVSNYCVNFAKEHGLSYVQDGLNNVIIKKPASCGYEDHPPVVLQGHLDMVCEKTADSDIDFTKDGLKLVVDGDLLTADGTTLGADDGIAVAMILAVLEDKDLNAPAIEALFTVDEETGMYGAQAVDVSLISGTTLINLDSGEEGVLTVGCAGGAKVNVNIPVTTEENTLPCKKIVLFGLCGGHSGIDINKGRQNADKLMGSLLSSLPFDFKLVSIHGGFKDNVIPNACECVVACKEDISKTAELFADKNRIPTDSGLTVSVLSVESAAVCLDGKSTARVLKFLNEVPFGVVSMNPDMPALVQSSMNLGVIKTCGNTVEAVLSVRSSAAGEKQKMLEQLEEIANGSGAEFSSHGHYPAWEYRSCSRLRDTMTEVYEELYGKKPIVETVHAGLECGLFNEKIKNFDAVSTGPDMWDIHTVNERLSISSVERTYKYLCETLKRL